MKMSRVKKPRGIKRAKKIVLFSSPCKSIINQFFKSRLKKKRLVNVRVYVIEKLFETHFPIPKYDAKWRGRKPALSSFFSSFLFFFSLCQKSKRSKYRRNDKSNSVACVKKKGFPSFSRRFFPCRFTDQRSIQTILLSDARDWNWKYGDFPQLLQICPSFAVFCNRSESRELNI